MSACHASASSPNKFGNIHLTALLFTSVPFKLCSVSWIPEVLNSCFVGPLVFFATKWSTQVLLFRVLCKRLCSPHRDALLTLMLPLPCKQPLSSVLEASLSQCLGSSLCKVRELGLLSHFYKVVFASRHSSTCSIITLLPVAV